MRRRLAVNSLGTTLWVHSIVCISDSQYFFRCFYSILPYFRTLFYMASKSSYPAYVQIFDSLHVIIHLPKFGPREIRNFIQRRDDIYIDLIKDDGRWLGNYPGGELSSLLAVIYL